MENLFTFSSQILIEQAKKILDSYKMYEFQELIAEVTPYINNTKYCMEELIPVCIKIKTGIDINNIEVTLGRTKIPMLTGRSFNSGNSTYYECDVELLASSLHYDQTGEYLKASIHRCKSTDTHHMIIGFHFNSPQSEHFNEKLFKHALLNLTNKISEVNAYESWSDEFKYDTIKESFAHFYDTLKEHSGIDFNNMTIDVATKIGMQRWEGNLFLFKLWMLPLIPEGLKVYDIFGDEFEYDSKSFDNDTRFGCVSYGIMIEEDK